MKFFFVVFVAFLFVWTMNMDSTADALVAENDKVTTKGPMLVNAVTGRDILKKRYYYYNDKKKRYYYYNS